jgi:hypothetical protein
MNKKVLLGGIVAGFVVFFWGFVSHTLLPLGEVGIAALPNEAVVVPVMRQSIQAPGFYMFPGMGKPHGEATEEEQKQWAEKYRQGPTGVLIYHPEGGVAMSPKQLGIELMSNILAGLLAAFFLSQAAGSLGGYGARMMFVGMFGLFSSFDILISYWNWYGFPGNFIMAGATDSVLGWTLAGAVLAAMIKPAAK